MYFFFNDTTTPEIYTDGHTLSLNDALQISPPRSTRCFPPQASSSFAPRRRQARYARLSPPSAPRPGQSAIPPNLRKPPEAERPRRQTTPADRKSTRLNSSP